METHDDGILFVYEQRKERNNEEGEVYQLLSDNYQDFLKIALENSDLRLFSEHQIQQRNDEEKERVLIIYDMLISLFERAYLLLYEEKMSEQQMRRWRTWEDFMLEWCRRSEFRAALPELLKNEDPSFVEYIHRLAKL